MGKLKEATQEWLENYGYSLGYDKTNYPAIDDWEDIKLNNIDAKEYYENYRSGSNSKTCK